MLVLGESQEPAGLYPLSPDLSPGPSGLFFYFPSNTENEDRTSAPRSLHVPPAHTALPLNAMASA